MRPQRLLTALLLATVAPSCATVAGTITSPLTGGVDAVTTYVDDGEWYWFLPVFIGGTIAAPFVAFYNGINYDADHLDSSVGYWNHFDDNFRPYRMLRSNL